MSLPVSRNRSYSDGMMLESVDMNDIQDWIVNLRKLAGSTAFGDQSDGAVTLDGVVAAPSGMTKSGTVYTMTRHWFFSDLVLTGAGVVLKANGFLPFGRSLTTVGGAYLDVTGGAGGNASGSTGGTAGAAPYVGGSTTFLQVDPSNYQAGAAGGNSGSGGGSAPLGMANAYGGAGGAGGAGTGAGTVPGANTLPAAIYGSPRAVLGPMMGYVPGPSGGLLVWHPIFGGEGGGGGGGGTAGAAGGGGGGGGGVLPVSFATMTLANATDLRAYGGAGGNATTGGDGNSGGGGGGGGGLVIAVYVTCNQTLSAASNAAGGAGGTRGGGGSSVVGSVGANGTVIQIVLA